MGYLNIGLVTSGRGTMLRWLLEGCQQYAVAGRLAAVVSNVDCPALQVARQASIPLVGTFPEGDHASRADRDQAMGRALRDAGVDLVVVAGYTQPIGAAMLDLFPDRAISMYPALLPAFGELDEAIGPALAYGVKTIGMTFHFCAPDSLSDGAIIAQEPVPVDVGDTVASVLLRLLPVEKTMLFDVLRAIEAGGISRDGNHVRFNRVDRARSGHPVPTGVHSASAG